MEPSPAEPSAPRGADGGYEPGALARRVVAVAAACGASDAAVVRLHPHGHRLLARTGDPAAAGELPAGALAALARLRGTPAPPTGADAGGWLAAAVTGDAGTWGAVCARADGESAPALAATLARLAAVLAAHLEATRAWRTSEEHLDRILDAVAEGVYGVDRDGRCTFINRAGAAMLGWPAADLIGRRTHEAVHHSHPDGRPYPAEDCGMVAAVREGREGRSDDEVFWRRDGTSFPVSYSTTPMRRDGEVVGAVVSFRDITQEKRALRRLRDSEKRFRTLTLHAPVGIFQADADGRYTFVSERWCEITGIPAEAALGEGWTGAVHPVDRDWVLADWRDAVGMHAPTSSEHRLHGPDGERWVLFDAVPLIGDDDVVQGFIGTITDVTQRRRAEEQARTDPLTGLANRRAFLEALDYEVSRARRAGYPVALVMVDLDHFKDVNDGHGHAAGDSVLVDTAARLREVARDDDTVARVGGEEFAWLLPGANLVSATGAAERARRAMRSSPFAEVGRVTISLGVAEARGQDAEGDDLMRRADRALYRAKRAGRDTVAH